MRRYYLCWTVSTRGEIVWKSMGRVWTNNSVVERYWARGRGYNADTQKPTAGSTVMQLCERVSWWSCTVWLLRSCRALESCGRRWIAVGSDSHWKSNCSFSSFCWSSMLSLEKGRWGGSQREKNSLRQKEAERRIKSCRWRENDGHLSYFWQQIMW